MSTLSESEDLLQLLGLSTDNEKVLASLHRFARGLLPQSLDNNVDWVTINEIGLEYGFEDEAYVRASNPDERRKGRLLLTQLYFYGDTERTRPFPYALPFSLTFGDNRATARRKLSEYESSRRSYVRDAWRLPAFDVTLSYRTDNGLLESIYCHIPHAPWPPILGLAERLAEYTPEWFVNLFGMRWSDAKLRSQLAPLGYDEALPQVRSEHVADLRYSYGLELVFAPGRKLKFADQRFPDVFALAYVTYYASRDLDAREWAGSLPCGLTFDDTQDSIQTKLGCKPASVQDDDRSGVAIWHFAAYTLSVVYSNIENRILRVMLLAPGYLSPVQHV